MYSLLFKQRAAAEVKKLYDSVGLFVDLVAEEFFLFAMPSLYGQIR